MDISTLSFTDILNMFFTKLKELSNLNKIDIANITSKALITLSIITLSCLVLWLIKGIGLYTMAKKRNDKFAFLAFIPYACLYTKGSIVGKTSLFGIDIEKTEFLLPLILISTFLPFTSIISLILLIFFYYGVLYRLYQKQVPNSAIILTLLSIILPILQPFFIFFIRNKDNKKIDTN